MGELDLSKAVEAGARVLTGQVLVTEYGDLNPQTQSAFNRDTANILTAALPHILDALAEEAYSEAMAMSYGLMEGDYEVPKATSEWLSQKAEELRGA